MRLSFGKRPLLSTSLGGTTAHRASLPSGVPSLCLRGHKPLPTPPGSTDFPHLPPGFNALVDIVRERAAGDEAAGPLGHVQVAVFQHDLALADDHQRSPTQLQPFKDVVLCSLETGVRGRATGVGTGQAGEEGSSCTWALPSASLRPKHQASQDKPTSPPVCSRWAEAPGAR